jgi:hypothetical protein
MDYTRHLLAPAALRCLAASAESVVRLTFGKSGHEVRPQPEY